MNPYQLRKAKLIAAVILQAACNSGRIAFAELPTFAAHFNESAWRAVSFAAGVPVADTPCRDAVIVILGGLV